MKSGLSRGSQTSLPPPRKRSWQGALLSAEPFVQMPVDSVGQRVSCPSPLPCRHGVGRGAILAGSGPPVPENLEADHSTASGELYSTDVHQAELHGTSKRFCRAGHLPPGYRTQICTSAFLAFPSNWLLSNLPQATNSPLNPWVKRQARMEVRLWCFS